MKTGINFERCNVGSAEMHNTRDPKYIAAVNASPNKKYSIFDDKTKTNTSWVNPEYSGKSLPGLLDELRATYKEKVGQAPQEEDRVREITDKKTGMKRTVTTAGWSPIREGVCPILPTTTISDFDPFIKWLESKGLKAVRLDLHHDEGHTEELTGERKYNHHAHLVVDWIDHTTGKTRKLSKIDTSEMQTQLAASLRMERGVSKTITGSDHLTPDEQRAKAAAEKVKLLEKQIAKAEQILNGYDKTALKAGLKAEEVKHALEAREDTFSVEGPTYGRYLVKTRKGYYYHDLQGKKLNTQPFKAASLFVDSKAVVVLMNGDVWEIDTNMYTKRKVQATSKGLTL